MTINDFNKMVCEMLGLDSSKVVTIDIHMEGRLPPKIVVTMAANKATMDELTRTITLITEEYQLVKKPEDKA